MLRRGKKDEACNLLIIKGGKGRECIPAKLIFTGRCASHVHAPLIFFNWSLALGTWL